jgi:ABC-type polysaccharide/polyol phosphate export permease
MTTKTTLSLLRFDLREAFDSVAWVAYYWFYFAFQFFVYGEIISRLVVTVNNYLFYYGSGLLILLSFNVASWAGRRFVESAHEGRLRYMLSLPLGRNELFLEQIVQGVIVNLTRVVPPLLLVLLVVGHFSPMTVVSSLLVLTLLTVGIIGLMVSLSVIAFRSFDIYSAIVASLSALLLRFSTVNYPLVSMNSGIAQVSTGNPLTYGADLFRYVLGFSPSILLDPVLSATVVIALCVGTMFIGMFFISRVVEGVKSS